MMQIGYGLRIGLYQEPRIAQRLEQVCRVCRQAFTREGLEAGKAVELVGERHAVCPCCRQPAPDPKDRNYRRRTRR